MGKSYAVRGMTPPRDWEPAAGEAIYIEGIRTRLGKPYECPKTGKTYFPLHPPVDGTTDMAAGNVKAIARLAPKP